MLERINLIIKTNNLSASQFADKVGVQRSSVSHVLSGRNKPSLEFIQKVIKKFPGIRTDWLLFGKGNMSNSTDLFSSTTEVITPTPDYPQDNEKRLNSNKDETDVNSIKSSDKPKEFKHKKENDHKTKSLVRIVLFYDDNSFSDHRPE